VPFNFGGYTALNFFFWALMVAAFVVEAWALLDAIRRPAAAFPAASKQTKNIWLLILGVATLIGVGGVFGYLAIFSIIPIVAFVAATVYHVDVKPKVKAIGPGSSRSNMGPYGPW
jgi:Protein of unknown function (DUF2516)